MLNNSVHSSSLSPLMKISIRMIFTVFLFPFVACQHNTLRKEMEQNRYFAEILKREDQRFAGKDTFFEKNLLSNPDPEIRQWAATALGRINSSQSFHLLYQALHDENPMVRAAAVFAIGEMADRETCKSQFRNQDPQAIVKLHPLLDDTSLTVRIRTVEALGKIGGRTEALKIIQRLEQFCYDGQPVERAFIVSSITALARLNHPDAIPILEKFAGTSDAEFQWRSLEALTRLHSTGSRQLFIDQLANSNFLVRSYAARGIGMLRDASLSGRLTSLLSPERDGAANPLHTRSFALQAVGDIRNPDSIPFIEAALKAAPIDHAHPAQQNFAIQAADVLGDMGNGVAEPVLSQLLQYPGTVLDTATIALAKINKENPTRFFTLAATYKLSEKAAPLGWTRALAQLNGLEAEKELTRMLVQEVENNNASNADIIPEILAAIAKTRSTESHEILEALMRSGDAAILNAVFSSYEPKEGSPEPWKPLLDALTASTASYNFEARLNLFGRLQPWIQQAPVQLALRIGLADDNYDVRQICAALLRKAGAVGIPHDIPSNRTLSDEMCNLLALNRKHITIAEIETNRGMIEIELFQENAPVTSFKFSLLAAEGAYNGTLLTRTDSEQRIGIQKLSPGKVFQQNIKTEINMRPIKRGSVGMTITGSQSNTGKLFIALQPQSYLDGRHTCFGHVISGMHIVDQIVPGDRIQRITVKTIYPYVKESDPSESVWHPLRGKGKLPK
jgi:peptidyl-prolyl cis-trans isomerase B (cyclophilin B)